VGRRMGNSVLVDQPQNCEGARPHGSAFVDKSRDALRMVVWHRPMGGEELARHDAVQVLSCEVPRTRCGQSGHRRGSHFCVSTRGLVHCPTLADRKTPRNH
jgi:hypothetical protein